MNIMQYLGIPYDIHNSVGVNCWGLYKLVKKQEQNKDVLVFTPSGIDTPSISAKFDRELSIGRHDHTKVTNPKNFDLALFTRKIRKSTIYHCGVWLDGKILHAKGSGQSGQVWYDSLASFDKWGVEYWRHD